MSSTNLGSILIFTSCVVVLHVAQGFCGSRRRAQRGDSKIHDTWIYMPQWGFSCSSAGRIVPTADVVPVKPPRHAVRNSLY